MSPHTAELSKLIEALDIRLLPTERYVLKLLRGLPRKRTNCLKLNLKIPEEKLFPIENEAWEAKSMRTHEPHSYSSIDAGK